MEQILCPFLRAIRWRMPVYILPTRLLPFIQQGHLWACLRECLETELLLVVCGPHPQLYCVWLKPSHNWRAEGKFTTIFKNFNTWLKIFVVVPVNVCGTTESISSNCPNLWLFGSASSLTWDWDWLDRSVQLIHMKAVMIWGVLERTSLYCWDKLGRSI